MSHLTSNPFGRPVPRRNARFIPFAHLSEVETSLAELLDCEELEQLEAIAERSWMDAPRAAPARALEMAAEAHIAG